MHVEGVAWEKLKSLAPESFDRYWMITIDFLKIASEAWPDITAEKNVVDASDVLIVKPPLPSLQ